MDQWWIEESLILGSRNPTSEGLERFYRLGFRTIVSLLDGDGKKGGTKEIPNYDVETARELGFVRYEIPVADYSAPSHEDFETFLANLEQSLHRGKIIVHCKGGTGRTGTMAAAYWIAKGLRTGEAIDKVRAANPEAIETEEQARSLFEFERHLRSFKEPASRDED